MKSTVLESTVKRGLCTSCGICSVVCPKQCIEYRLLSGQYLPQIDDKTCVSCGKCADVCSNSVTDFEDISKPIPKIEQLFTGNIRAVYNLASKSADILKEATSGGAVTTIIKYLLENNIYDIAFLVDTFQYDHFVTTEPFLSDGEFRKSQKSRYIPISHQKMAQYALENHDKKIIVVATSCVIHTIKNFIRLEQLNCGQFLFLGLFCDRTLNYNIFEYFKSFSADEKSLENLYFRTKEGSGWPGNVKLEYTDGSNQYLNAKERMLVKDYFQLERCLYCLDKLNRDADISFGDNYTGNYQNKKSGESTIVVRTAIGENIFKMTEKLFSVKTVNKQMLNESQHLDMRRENITNIKIKSGSTAIDKKERRRYDNRIYKIKLGKEYFENPQMFKKEIDSLKKKQFVYKLKNKVKGFLRH